SSGIQGITSITRVVTDSLGDQREQNRNVFRLRGSHAHVRVRRAFGRNGLFATGGYASGLRTESMMHKMDTNHDNMVSRKEWIAFQNKVFAMLDKKKIGMVDEHEYMAASPPMASFATGGYASG